MKTKAGIGRRKGDRRRHRDSARERERWDPIIFPTHTDMKGINLGHIKLRIGIKKGLEKVFPAFFEVLELGF